MEYWAPLATNLGAFRLEGRAELALRIIERFALVAGNRGAEDSAGRAALELQPPAELVERAFQIADEFIRVAESRGLIQHPDVDAVLEKENEFAARKDEAETARWQARALARAEKK